jgi:hypothetical protein
VEAETMGDYRYAIVLYRQNGTCLGQAAVQPDFEPALGCTRFWGMRLGRLPPLLASGGGVAAPIWDPQCGEPFISGVRSVVPDADGREIGCDIPLQYFAPAAQQLVDRQIEAGRLEEDGKYFYKVAAVPQADVAAGPAARTGAVRRLDQPLPVDDLALESLLSRAEPPDPPDPVDMPVFIHEAVREETAALARGAGSQETGGILVGRLHRDPAYPEIFAEVTAQIPARHTQGDLMRLTFTADTWAEARAALEARGLGELMLGWWHSHSYLKELCKDCSHRGQPDCRCRAEGFSPEDRWLHRTVFPRAFCVGLVVCESPCAELSQVLFGWRLGMIVRRSYHWVKSAAGGDAAPRQRGGLVHDTK